MLMAAAAANVVIGLGAAVGQEPLAPRARESGSSRLCSSSSGRSSSRTGRCSLGPPSDSTSRTSPSSSEPLPLPGGTRFFPTDVLLLLAVGAWLAVTPDREVRRVRRPTLARIRVAARPPRRHGRERVAVGQRALRRKHHQTKRFASRSYAGIALALIDVSCGRRMAGDHRGVLRRGGRPVALGRLLPRHRHLTDAQRTRFRTGGVRVLALSVAIYLTGSLVCALLNLELERRPDRQLLHLADRRPGAVRDRRLVRTDDLRGRGPHRPAPPRHPPAISAADRSAGSSPLFLPSAGGRRPRRSSTQRRRSCRPSERAPLRDVHERLGALEWRMRARGQPPRRSGGRVADGQSASGGETEFELNNQVITDPRRSSQLVYLAPGRWWRARARARFSSCAARSSWTQYDGLRTSGRRRPSADRPGRSRPGSRS